MRIPILMLFWLLCLPLEAQVCGPGASLEFDGTDDHVLVPYDPSFPTETFTAAWIRTDPPGFPARRRAIIARGEDDNSWDGPWFFQIGPNGTLEVQIENIQMTNGFYDSGFVVADSAWHHVAVTRSLSGELNFYSDGVLVATTPNTLIPSADNQQFLSIGCTHGYIGPPPGGVEPPLWFFLGRIGEPAVWDRALDTAEIATVREVGVQPDSPGLIGSWHLDEGAGQAVEDRSPEGNDGFLGTLNGVDSADPAWVAEPFFTSYGCGVNPVGSLVSLGGAPDLGGTWRLGVDNPLGTQGPGSFAVLIVSRAAAPGFPCGPTFPGFGMAGPGAPGELLIGLNQIALQVGPSVWAGPGIPAPIDLVVPNNPNLVGVCAYAQGLLFDPNPASGVSFGLTEAASFCLRSCP
jgi:hypothetical protein